MARQVRIMECKRICPESTIFLYKITDLGRPGLQFAEGAPPVLDLDRWPNWLRWILVVIAPFVAFILANFILTIIVYIRGEEGVFLWITQNIIHAGLCSLAAVYAAGVAAPSSNLFAAIYGLCLIVILVTLGVLVTIFSGDYIKLIPLLATLGGGAFGIYHIRAEYGER